VPGFFLLLPIPNKPGIELADFSGKPWGDAKISLRACGGIGLEPNVGERRIRVCGPGSGRTSPCGRVRREYLERRRNPIDCDCGRPRRIWILTLLGAGIKRLGVAAPGPRKTEKKGPRGRDSFRRRVSVLPLKRARLQVAASGGGHDDRHDRAANFTTHFASTGSAGGGTPYSSMDAGQTTVRKLAGDVCAFQTGRDSGSPVQFRVTAEIGQGAAGFTNVVTKIRHGQLHGSHLSSWRMRSF